MFEKNDKNSLFVSEELDRFFMREALIEAEKAKALDEVPVGAIVVHKGEIIARAHNRRETDKCATHHAELLAIEDACRALGGWRLPNCTLFVTLEPCPMCAGSIINSRISRVVFGASDKKAGAFGSVLDLNSLSLNHKVEIKSGVLSQDCSKILTEYFREKRAK